MCCWIPLRLPGAIIVTDYLVLEAILRRIGANTIHVSFTTEFFRTRIYRIDTDASLMWGVPPPDKIRYILIIRVRFTTEFFPNTDLLD